MAAELRLSLANVLWRGNAREEAWAIAAAAAQADPALGVAWNLLRSWAPALEKREELVELARAVVRERPGEARGWLSLATILPPWAFEEQIAAYDAAIARDPRMVEAYDLKAQALAASGRLDAAETVLRETPWGAELPGPLQ